MMDAWSDIISETFIVLVHFWSAFLASWSPFPALVSALCCVAVIRLFWRLFD